MDLSLEEKQLGLFQLVHATLHAPVHMSLRLLLTPNKMDPGLPISETEAIMPLKQISVSKLSYHSSSLPGFSGVWRATFCFSKFYPCRSSRPRVVKPGDQRLARHLLGSVLSFCQSLQVPEEAGPGHLRANLTLCSSHWPEFGAVVLYAFYFTLTALLNAFVNWPWKVLQNPQSRYSLPGLCLLVMLQECGPTASTPWWLSLVLMSCVFQALLGGQRLL